MERCDCCKAAVAVLGIAEKLESQVVLLVPPRVCVGRRANAGCVGGPPGAPRGRCRRRGEVRPPALEGVGGNLEGDERGG